MTAADDDFDEGSRSAAASEVLSDDPAPRALDPGWRHREGGELGRGGMGVVNAAFDPVLERNVALKRALVTSPAGEAWLLREAKLAARLDHPSIATVLELARDEAGRLTAVLPVRQGRSFAEAAAEAKGPTAPLLRALLVASQAVAHAHARGVLHRDLSPANVRLGDDGAVWVLDWGLAATVEEAAQGGFTGGTAGYTPPEQREGWPTTPATDVWSLGALLHLACTGRAPTQQRPRDCPRPLWAIVQKALRDEPAARYPDAAAFAAELARWLDGAPVEAWPEGLAARLVRIARRRPRLALAAGAGVMGVLLSIATAAVLVARAQANEQVATASLLLDSAERALHQDDVRTAKRLATEALRTVDSPRARGVLAATARVSEVTHTTLPASDCQRVDVWGTQTLCAESGELELRGAPTVRLGPGDTGAVLASGMVVTASRANSSVQVFDGEGTRVQQVVLGGGLPQLRTDLARTVAVVAVPDGLAHFDGTLRVVRPCTPGQGLHFAVTTGARTEVLCADGELIALDAVGGELTRRRILGLSTLLRGAVTGDLLDPHTLVLGAADGSVGVISLERAEVTRVSPTGVGFPQLVRASRDGRAVLISGEQGAGVWRVGEGHLLPLDLRGLEDALPEGESGFLAWSSRAAWSLSVTEQLSVSTDLHGRSGLAVDDATRRVAVGDSMGRVELFSLDTGLQAAIDGPARVIKSLAFSASGRWLALGAAGAEGVMVFDTSVSPPVRVKGAWEGHPELRGRHVVFLGELLLVFSWGPGPWAARYDEAAGAFVEVEVPSLPPDIKAVQQQGNVVHALDVLGGWHELTLRGDGSMTAARLATWSPVPTAVADFEGTVTAVGKVVQRGSTRLELAAPVEGLALSSTGHLAICRRDGVVEVRDAQNVLTLEVPAHEGRCSGVRFCDGERAVCSIGWDGRLRVIER